MKQVIQNIIFAAVVVLCVYNVPAVFASDNRMVNVVITPFDSRNCDMTFSKSVTQKAEQSLAMRASGTGVTLAGEKSVGSFALAGAAANSDALYFEKLSDGAPDVVLVGRVEGSEDNRGDSPNAKYRISVRLLGSRTDGALFGYTSDWMRSGEFDRAADQIADKILARIGSWNETRAKKQPEPSGKESSSVKWFPYMSFLGCTPTGSFASIAKDGFGVNAGIGIDDLSLPLLDADRLVFRGAVGLYGFTPSRSNVKSLFALTATAGTGRNFSFGFASVTPLLHAGFLLGIMNRAEQQATDGTKSYKTGYYADPLVSLSVECSKVISNATITVSPFYSLFFEKGNTGQFVGVSFGAGYGF